MRAKLIGKIFGRLSVKSFLDVRNGHAFWLCKCICGNTIQVRTASLTSLNTQSCGCLHKDIVKARVQNRPATCHPEKKHYAFGLCTTCYNRGKTSPEESKRYRQNLKNRLGPVKYSLYLRERNLQNNYKLTMVQFEKLKASQNYACPCGRFFGEKWIPQVDHNHACCAGVRSCGECVRGILCSRCNTVLGLLEEDYKLLPAYLQKYLSAYA